MDHYYYPYCSGLSVEKRAKPVWTTSKSSSSQLKQLIVWIISHFLLSYWRSVTAITENVRPQMKREKNTLKLRGAAGKAVLCLWHHSVYCQQTVRESVRESSCLEVSCHMMSGYISRRYWLADWRHSLFEILFSSKHFTSWMWPRHIAIFFWREKFILEWHTVLRAGYIYRTVLP